MGEKEMHELALALELARPFLPQPATRLERIAVAIVSHPESWKLNASQIADQADKIDTALTLIEAARKEDKAARDFERNSLHG